MDKKGIKGKWMGKMDRRKRKWMTSVTVSVLINKLMKEKWMRKWMKGKWMIIKV